MTHCAIGRMARDAGALWVGASTPGLAIPGEMKLGFLPDVSLRPGPLGMMSKSGTLSYETGYRLGAVGLGTSIWVGVGGDPVKGVRFPDLLDTFLADERTKGIVLVGEVGGSEEEDFADALARSSRKQAGLCAGGGPRRQGGRADGTRRCAGVRRHRHVRDRRSAGWRPPARRFSLRSRI